MDRRMCSGHGVMNDARDVVETRWCKERCACRVDVAQQQQRSGCWLGKGVAERWDCGWDRKWCRGVVDSASI
jgi:hypothetical protein